MPHFVVTEFHGKRHHAIEFYYSATKSDGSKRWPQVIEAIEISDQAIRTYTLDEMIAFYEKGIRPKPPTPFGWQPSIAMKMTALPKPKPKNEMG